MKTASSVKSSSAYGWLRESNFSDADRFIVQMTKARQLANLILQSQSCLYSQWFPGGENLISNSLSRDFHLNDSELTKLILSPTPSQAPFKLKIRQLPNKISSWLTCMLQNLPEKEQWSKEPQQSSLWLGRGTRPTCNRSESIETGTWTTFQETRGLKSSAPFAMLSEKADFILCHSRLIKLNQFEPP